MLATSTFYKNVLKQFVTVTLLFFTRRIMLEIQTILQKILQAFNVVSDYW